MDRGSLFGKNLKDVYGNDNYQGQAREKKRVTNGFFGHSETISWVPRVLPPATELPE